ncbi:MAG: hypothetical protein LOY04_17950, partial [Rhodococcus ruber]|nr:hypothetical protein [Rhodococcus ruber]
QQHVAVGLPAEVDRVRGLGYEMHGWPLRGPEDVGRALAFGLDGGTADDPGAARYWLAAALVSRPVG